MVEGLGIISALLLVVWYIQRREWDRRCQGFSLPPGPKQLPLLGNLLDMKQVKHPWLVYQKWAETYGKICFSKHCQHIY